MRGGGGGKGNSGSSDAISGAASIAAPSIESTGDVVYMSQPLDRPETLPGRTYKLKWPGSDHAI